MKTIAFSTSYWHNQRQAIAKKAELVLWRGMIDELIKPSKIILTCGTESNPDYCPIHGVEVLNSHVMFDRPYDFIYWNYAVCAYNAALWYAVLNCWPFDLLIGLETDVVVANVNIHEVISQFMSRREAVCGPHWQTHIDGSFLVLKPEAVIRMIHFKAEPALYINGKIPLDNQERIITDSVRDSWWDPWPEIETIRMDYQNPYAVQKSSPPDDTVNGWPFVRMPRPGLQGILLKRYHPEINWDKYL